MVYHIIQYHMDNLDNHTIALILSNLPTDDIHRLHKTSVRIFRIVIGTIQLRCKLYASWEDIINANDLQVLDYLAKLHMIPENVLMCDTYVMTKSALKCLHDNGYPWDKQTCSIIAECGSFECLKYAHENGCEWDESTCVNAAMHDALECLQYAREHGCGWSEWICNEAASTGSLHCLMYAHKHGGNWNDQICADAAINGYIDCLRYAHENGCPLRTNNTDACVSAAMRGSLECMQYAYENGCVIDELVCVDAITSGSLDCFKYAYTHASECDLHECLDIAMEYTQHEIIEYIRTLIWTPTPV